VFKPNLKENHNRTQLGISIACVVLASFLLIFVLYNLFTSGNGGINFNYFFTLQGSLNFVIIILIYVIHTLMKKLNDYKITELILTREVDPTVQIPSVQSNNLRLSTIWQLVMKQSSF